MVEEEFGEHLEEENLSARLNWLRAGVLGANDGVVSVAALLVGVAAANPPQGIIVTAGIAGIAAGALSMGIGEYVSVSSQRDAERAQLKREQLWQETRPDWELEQLVRLNMETGMSEDTARRAATEQHDHDPVAIHAKMHLGIDPDDIVNPWSAGIASFIAFTTGGMFPLLTMLLAPDAARIAATFAIVVVALAATGFISARLGRSKRRIGVLRNVVGGALAMAITYGIGSLVGTAV
jgi:VIT1/CCC1 family predicted Fe2+/Mn2+ transporter